MCLFCVLILPNCSLFIFQDKLVLCLFEILLWLNEDNLFVLKCEKSNLLHIQTKDNLVILTCKTDTLITPTTFLKKCEKMQWELTYKDGGV